MERVKANAAAVWIIHWRSQQMVEVNDHGQQHD
jgi:hypothetical protein